MTRATVTPETETTIILDRLAALDSPLPEGHMSEVAPWLAAARVGSFELPAKILDLVTMALHLATLNKAHVKPLEHRTVNVQRLLQGASTADVLDADDAAAIAKTRWERAGELLIAAEGSLAGLEGDTFGDFRDALITGPLRETVAALLHQAKSAAGKLQAFAPDYPPALLETANQSELTTWRQSRQLQRDFDTMVRAWSTSWWQATHHGTPLIPPDFYPCRAGGYYVWRDAWAVEPEALRYGQDAEILRIAMASSEYRLLAPCEWADLIDRLTHNVPVGAPFAGIALAKWKVCGG